MSLDVYLFDANGDEIYSANITHNLGAMAEAAGIYNCLWRPEEHGMTKARDIIAPLAAGLALLIADPDRFSKLDSPNGWGTWRDFLPFCARYLAACRANPEARVEVSR